MDDIMNSFARVSTDSQVLEPSVQARLLEAACGLFQNNDYNKVTTRQLAAKASTSSAMIKYCYGSKQGLYEEMIRQQFYLLEQALFASYDEEKGLNLTQLLVNYVGFHKQNPAHCKFIMSILAYKEGPGYLLLSQLLDRKWDTVKSIIKEGQKNNHITKHLDVDVFRIALTSLSVFPFLIKDVLEQSNSIVADNILEKVARFSASILDASLEVKNDDIWAQLKEENLTCSHYHI